MLHLLYALLATAGTPKTNLEYRAVGNARKGPSSIRLVTFGIITAHISRRTTF